MYNKPLVKSAKKLGFESKFFSANPWKYSYREPMRYQLWLEELKQWILDNYNLFIFVRPTSITIPDGNFINVIAKGYTYRIHDITKINDNYINSINIIDSYVEMLSAGIHRAIVEIETRNLEKNNLI